jgi:ABC-2 type transport system ATP-binding protein
MTALEVRRLTKRYGPVTAVDDLSFALQPGSVTGFVGRNGAGKSTTIRVLLGLTRPTAGEALIAGRRYAELRHPLREVGALVQPDVFHPGRRGRDALRVVARPAGITDDRVDEVLDLVDLTAAGRRRVGGYSLGMRQRLALAAAVLGDPAVLVLDEPVNGLDPDGVRDVRLLVRRFAAEGRTVLVSSHLLAELATTVDQVVVIDRGQLVVHAPLAELLAAPGAGSLEDVFFSVTAPSAPSAPSTATAATAPTAPSTATAPTAVTTLAPRRPDRLRSESLEDLS